MYQEHWHDRPLIVPVLRDLKFREIIRSKLREAHDLTEDIISAKSS